MTTPRVAVLFGGPSSEHEVSRASAEQVMQALENKPFQVQPVFITREEKWQVYPSRLSLAADTPSVVLATDQVHDYLPFHFDTAFIALHGTFGEDGTVQRILDRSTLPYQGSGPRASRVAFDKAETQRRLRRVGLSIPEYMVLTRAEWVATRARKIRQLIMVFGSSLVVKPVSEGSSVGVVVTHTAADLTDAIEHISTRYDRFMVQRYIRGTEVTCAVVEFDDDVAALPPTLIRPRQARFFDYQAKYTPGATEEITPAPLAPQALAYVQAVALKVHRTLQLRDYSRTDIIIGQGGVWVLEVNTLPGITETSLLPQAAAAFGVTFTDLIEHLVQRSLSRPEVIELS